MNKNQWKYFFEKDNYPDYPCPNCDVGILKLVDFAQKRTAKVDEPFFSHEQEEYEFSKSGKKYNFAAILKCGNIDCQHSVSMIGHYRESYEDYSPEKNSMDWFSTYYPKYFYPNLKLFRYPNTISKEIENELNLSFSNFFNDVATAANKIRKAIELIVTELRAPKYTLTSRRNSTTGRRKKHFFDLHTRITKLRKAKKKTSDMLLGLKVIGNEGSHSSSNKIKHEDILEAYSVLEFVLEKEFLNKEQEILEIAEKLKNRK